MSFKKTLVNGYEINVAIENRIVRIENDTTLQDMLKNTDGGARQLAVKTHQMYREIIGADLDISTESLAIEIYGHVYPGKILEKISDLPLPDFVRTKVNSLIERTDVIDCGELAVDNNRWVWDTLASIKGLGTKKTAGQP